MERVPMVDDGDAVRRAEPSRGPDVETKTDDFTVTAADHGKIFLCNDAGDGCVATLPAPTEGLTFTFMKANATTDIELQAPAGVSINFGTAGKQYQAVTDGDGVPVVCTIRGSGTTAYHVVNRVGTWANDNS